MKIAFPFLSIVAALSLTELGVAAQVLSPSLDHVVDTLPFDPVTPLVPSDAGAGHGFGGAVSVSGDRAAVGAQGAGLFGAVYVFERHGEAWLEVARLESGERFDENFGASVSIHGNRLVVGAWRAAYVFTRQHGAWSQTAKLTSPTADPDDGFGAEVAVHGQSIAVSAPNALDQWDIDAGAVFVFEHDGGGWLPTVRLDYPGGGYGGDAFGQSLALQDDRLISGVPFAKVDGHDEGRAFAFRRAGSQWNSAADLTSTADTTAHLHMGTAVALDGNVVVVGAPGDGPGLGFDVPGAAYVFRKSGNSWELEAKLAADDELLDAARFGTRVAVRGNTVLVSASEGYAEGATTPGSVYVFQKTRIGWVQTDEWATEWDGEIALGDGFAIVGAASADVAGTNSGSAEIRALDGRVPALASSPGWVQFWQDTPGGGFAGGFDGSKQRLLLDATPVNGGLPFVVLGSMSGTTPGTAIDGFVVPLVEDTYFQDTLGDPSSTPLIGSTGVLDAMGRAAARFAVPPGGFDQELVGTTFHHAFVVLDPATQRVVFASNAAPVTLVY